MFHCEEYEFAPEWDRHTPQEAIERIGKLDLGISMFGVWKPIEKRFVKHAYKCGVCGYVSDSLSNHCQGCGARMKIVYG